jgi:hypothetical protein
LTSINYCYSIENYISTHAGKDRQSEKHADQPAAAVDKGRQAEQLEERKEGSADKTAADADKGRQAGKLEK